VRKTIYTAALLLLACGAEANASLVVRQWYHGRWSCLIDGRPSHMDWKQVNATRQTCSGGVCTQVPEVRQVGWFWDRSGPWVRLYYAGSSDRGLSMLHANRDPWVLNRTSASQAIGHTTWQGRRYPLSCNKA
jgi:hypothetical protein